MVQEIYIIDDDDSSVVVFRELFKNDKEYLYNKKNIMKISIIFSVLWILMIIIAFIIIIMNSYSNYIKRIIDILYSIIKMSQI